MNNFQEQSKENAKKIIKNFLTTGLTPVVFENGKDYMEGTRIPASAGGYYAKYYFMGASSIDAPNEDLCFFPDLEEAAAAANLEFNKDFELIEVLDKYEDLAASFGYAA
jgi:hypothetical protein